MQTATSFGGPFVVLPRRLVSAWVTGIGDRPEQDRGLYGKVCGPHSHMHVIHFHGTDVLRVAEDPGDLYWVPRDGGGLIVQWIAADSLGELIEFGKDHTNCTILTGLD